MQDRVSLYPGRVKLTPVAGQANTYDLTRADQPTQEGTPLNKASLLKDTTAALFGLTTDAVPDDVLMLLSRFQNKLGNEYIWSKSQQNTTVNYGSPTTIKFTNSNASNDWVQIQYSETIQIDEYGSVTLENPSIIMIGPPPNKNMPANKYFALSGKVYYTANGSSQTSSGNICYDAKLVTGTIVKEISYLNSPDPNAYPPAVSDGYTYTALGQLGNKVQMAIGTYTGTGTYGNSNPNSLTFDFTPKIVFISANTLSNGYGEIYLIKDCPCAMGTGNLMFQFVSFNGNTVSWYGNEATKQANYTGNIYYYIAIG